MPNHHSSLENLNPEVTPLAYVKLISPDNRAEIASASRKRTRYNRDTSKKFSSLRPNQALIWALVDDSPGNADEREQAKAIIEGWNPEKQLWKGMRWQDQVWTGSQWEPETALPIVYKPLLPSTPSKVTIGVTDTFANSFLNESYCRIGAEELNQAYDAYVLDPIEEADNLWVTVAAFARSQERLAQCRKLIVRQLEIAMTVDDIFMKFTTDVFDLLKGDYKHQGTLERWIAVVWSNFIVDVKEDVWTYADLVRRARSGRTAWLEPQDCSGISQGRGFSMLPTRKILAI